MDSKIVRPLLYGALLLWTGCDRDTTPFSTQDADRFRSNVAGRVVDGNGAPLRGALVTSSPGGVTTVSGDSGAFQIAVPSGSYSLSVSKDDYLDTTLSDSLKLALLQNLSNVRVGVVYRYATLKGAVVDSSDNPVPGAGVIVEDQSVSTFSVSGGNFTLGRVEPGAVRLFAAASGVGYGVIDTLLGPSDTVSGLRVKVDRAGGTVSGRVVVSAAARVSTGAARSLAGGQAGVVVSALGGRISATTAADGSFTLPNVPSGGVTLSFAGTGQSFRVGGVACKEGRHVDIGDIQLETDPAPGDTVVRAGLVLGWTGSRLLTMLATTGSDSALHVRRWAWSHDAGSNWDSTSTGRSRVDPVQLGWMAPGDFKVSVKAVSLDTARRILRSSKAGTITVRLRDSTSALSALSVDTGSLFPRVFLPEVASYLDTVPALAGHVTISATAAAAGAQVACGTGSCANIAIPSDTSLSVVVANPASGSSRTYTVAIFHHGGLGGPALADSVFWNSAVAYDTLLDPRDSQSYRTIAVGGVRWMAQNLSYKADSSWCPSGAAGDTCARSGRLYSWSAAMGLQPAFDTGLWNGTYAAHTGVCPVGWHLPVPAEWSALLDAVGRDTAGPALRASRGWGLSSGSDPFGFRALPAGRRNAVGNYTGFGSEADFRTSAEGKLGGSPVFSIGTGATVDSTSATKSGGFSVRCVQDAQGSVLDNSTALASLKVDTGRFSPAFVSSKYSYVDSIPWNDSILGLTVSAASLHAGITIQDGIARAVKVPRDTTVRIEVANAGSSQLYSIQVVHRPKPDSAPILKLVSPARGTVVHNTGRLVAVWKAVTNKGIASARFAGSDFEAVRDSGSVYAAWYSDTLNLSGGSFQEGLTVQDSAGTTTSDTATFIRLDTVPDTVTGNWNMTVKYGNLSDSRDGQGYRTVTIGKQTWMAQNLNYFTATSRCPSDSADSCAVYGRVYSWSDAMNTKVSYQSQWLDSARTSGPVQGVCPSGWHLPDSTEWSQLFSVVGSSAAGRELGAVSGWNASSTVKFQDSVGFRALPVGDRMSGQGIWTNRGLQAMFWSKTEPDAYDATVLGAYTRGNFAYVYSGTKSDLYPVRCLHD
jgi:uncharacterized protein (TIGR02145 family)